MVLKENKSAGLMTDEINHWSEKKEQQLVAKIKQHLKPPPYGRSNAFSLLLDIVKDSFHSNLVTRTFDYWADKFHVSYSTIGRWYKQLKDDELIYAVHSHRLDNGNYHRNITIPNLVKIGYFPPNYSSLKQFASIKTLFLKSDDLAKVARIFKEQNEARKAWHVNNRSTKNNQNGNTSLKFNLYNKYIDQNISTARACGKPVNDLLPGVVELVSQHERLKLHKASFISNVKNRNRLINAYLGAKSRLLRSKKTTFHEMTLVDLFLLANDHLAFYVCTAALYEENFDELNELRRTTGVSSQCSDYYLNLSLPDKISRLSWQKWINFKRSKGVEITDLFCRKSIKRLNQLPTKKLCDDAINFSIAGNYECIMTDYLYRVESRKRA